MIGIVSRRIVLGMLGSCGAIFIGEQIALRLPMIGIVARARYGRVMLEIPRGVGPVSFTETVMIDRIPREGIYASGSFVDRVTAIGPIISGLLVKEAILAILAGAILPCVCTDNGKFFAGHGDGIAPLR